MFSKFAEQAQLQFVFSLNSIQTGCLLGLLSEFYECFQDSLLRPCTSTLLLVSVTR